MGEQQVLYYADGVLTGNNVLVLACGFLAAPDTATSRILLNFDDGWASHDVADDFIVSILYSERLGEVIALGKNGLIKVVGDINLPFTFNTIKGKWRETWIEGVDERGHMTKIKEIGDSIYACGWGSQIYKLVNGDWLEIYDRGENGERVAFLDIDGVDSNNIYAVGMDGVVFHYDGAKWGKIELVTNCNFHFVMAVSDQKMIIGGSSGALYYGLNDKWNFIGNDNVTENIWAVKEFQSNIYLATSSGVKKYDWLTLEDVGFNLKGTPTVNHFAASSSELVSIGEYDLTSFNGLHWSKIDCIANR